MLMIGLACVAVMVAVGVFMIRNKDTGDNRLFWQTFGGVIIGLAGLVAYLALHRG